MMSSPDEAELSPSEHHLSPAEDSDVLLSPTVEGPEPRPGLDGTPVRCEF